MKFHGIVTNWHYKHLDNLAAIGRRMAENTALPDAARATFLEAHNLADTFKHDAKSARDRSHVWRIFDSLCRGCREAGLYACKESEATLQFCRLIREHSM